MRQAAEVGLRSEVLEVTAGDGQLTPKGDQAIRPETPSHPSSGSASWVSGCP